VLRKEVRPVLFHISKKILHYQSFPVKASKNSCIGRDDFLRGQAKILAWAGKNKSGVRGIF
jgi:hypothetical protein